MSKQTHAKLTRDQERAILAYRAVSTGEDALRTAEGKLLTEKEFGEYKILVYGLGPQVMRSGLSATLSFIERRKGETAARHLLEVLAKSNLPGLSGVEAGKLAHTIRHLAVEEYMLVTREVLALSIWLRRAVQGRDSEQTGESHA